MHIQSGRHQSQLRCSITGKLCPALPLAAIGNTDSVPQEGGVQEVASELANNYTNDM